MAENLLELNLLVKNKKRKDTNLQTKGTSNPFLDRSNEMQNQTHCHQRTEYQRQKNLEDNKAEKTVYL